MKISPKAESTLQQLFRETCRCGETSFFELARKLGLKPSTLDEKLRILQRRGLIIVGAGGASLGAADAKRARARREVVRVNPGLGYLVGIDMGASHLHFARTDFLGEILADLSIKIRPEDGPARMITQIKENVRELAEAGTSGNIGRRRSGARPRLQGLAIGVPSPVDPKTGLVSFANNLPGWTNITLRDELQKAFGVPVALENDANMAALGEHWRGVARGVDNFVFIALGTGIGSGIFADGRLIRGRTGAAGELYRLNVEWQRWNDDFGDTGYYESHVSGLGIAAEGRRQLDRSLWEGRGSGPGRTSEGLAGERDAYFVFEAFRRGDPKAHAALEKVFTMLGVGVADLVAVLDPDLIVLGGGITKGAPEFMLSTVAKVANRIQPGGPPIKLSALGDRAQTYGAIFSALTLAQQRMRSRL